MRFRTKLARMFEPLAIPNICLYLIIGQAFFFLTSLLGAFDVERIALLPQKVYAGEYWRVVSFVFLPPASSALWIAFVWYMFYLMGSALEAFWGPLKFNLFLLVGFLLTVAAAFCFPRHYASNVFIGGSVFLAFAFLNPDFQLYIFFILPVKIRWLAAVTWAGYIYEVFVGSWPERFLIFASIGNFMIFFSRDIFLSLRSGQRQMVRQATNRPAEDEARHRCVVCGKTDLTNPEEDFRYCSKCVGAHAYCQEHLRNHEHILVDEEK